MSPPKVKICGITQLEDARYCAGAGADYLGFIQYEGSPRYLTPAKAKEIIDWVYGPAPVGVFVNSTADEINESCAQAGFRIAQLHGHETPETCAAVDVPVIKAFSVSHDASSEQLLAIMEPYRGIVDYFLLDTHSTSLYGGTGESFNWRLARELADSVPLFLAGGLNDANVREAVQTIRPFALDLSSSVETSPGIKDFDKLGAFFDAYRDAIEDEA